MTRSNSSIFSHRISRVAAKKKSRLIVAIDPDVIKRKEKKTSSNSSLEIKRFAIRTIDLVSDHVCAIKVNFHLLLPLSSNEIFQVTKRAHNRQLLCIADIKLNDISNTNEVALRHLAAMGFDAIIANPFMGEATLTSLVKTAHKLGLGVIALVYMSHVDAKDGYGLRTSAGHYIYREFLHRAAKADADGIVIGATQTEILKEVTDAMKDNEDGLFKRPLQIYSPGVGAQGADAGQAIKNGSDYLIVGRAIVNSKDPIEAAKEFKLEAGPPLV